MIPSLLRSALYVPASNVRAIEKARSLDSDAVILDLEDAVAPDAKVAAREHAIAVAAQGGFGDRLLVIRANALDTEWGRDDVLAIRNSGAAAVLIPKLASAQTIADLETLVEGAPQAFRTWAMIETCGAILALDKIATAARGSRLACFVAGTNDLLKEMRATQLPGRDNLAAMLSLTVAAGRTAGVAVLDGVFNDFNDPDGLAAECRQGRSFGFDGKTLIHPSQIAACNELFAPTAQEVADASKIAAAFAEPGNSSAGVIQVEGRMVERLHAEIAQTILAKAALIEARQQPAEERS